MPFDKDAEHDPNLANVAAGVLLSHYEEQFQGLALCKKMKTQTSIEEDKKLVPRIDKAIKAALADLETLVGAIDPSSEFAEDAEAAADADEGDEAGADADGEDEGEDGEEQAEPAEAVSLDATNDATLLELFWRIQNSWSTVPAPKRAETAGNLKMIVVANNTPSWIDLASIMGELSAIDREVGETTRFPKDWYGDLLERFETKLGKKKPKKKASTKAEKVIRTPPAGANIIEYSAKQTFSVGDWVSHPKFGTGYVVESGANVLIEFGAEEKRLAHVPPSTAPTAMPKLKIKGPDSAELARAAGIEIKKIPARELDEDKK